MCRFIQSSAHCITTDGSAGDSAIDGVSPNRWLSLVMDHEKRCGMLKWCAWVSWFVPHSNIKVTYGPTAYWATTTHNKKLITFRYSPADDPKQTDHRLPPKQPTSHTVLHCNWGFQIKPINKLSAYNYWVKVDPHTRKYFYAYARDEPTAIIIILYTTRVFLRA